MTSGPNCGSVGHAMVREAGGTDVPCTPSPNLSPYPDTGPTRDNWVWSGRSQRPLLGPWGSGQGEPPQAVTPLNGPRGQRITTGYTRKPGILDTFWMGCDQSLRIPTFSSHCLTTSLFGKALAFHHHLTLSLATLQ